MPYKENLLDDNEEVDPEVGLSLQWKNIEDVSQGAEEI
jgi:hypothetical protein